MPNKRKISFAQILKWFTIELSLFSKEMWLSGYSILERHVHLQWRSIVIGGDDHKQTLHKTYVQMP